MLFYNKYNPYFRKQLLNSIVGKKLKDFVEINWVNETNSKELLNSPMKLFSLQFDHTWLNMFLLFPNTFVLYEDCYSYKVPIQMFSDSIQKIPSRFHHPPTSKYKLVRESIADKIGSCIGQRVIRVSLLGGGVGLRSIFPNSRHVRKTSTEVRGFTLHFNNGKSLFIYLNFDIKGTLLKVETNCEWLKEGVLERKDFFLSGKSKEQFGELPDSIFSIDVYKILKELDEILINREACYQDFEIRISLRERVNATELKNNILKYKINKTNEYIHFLVSLKEKLIKEQFGLIDLKFGLDKSKNLKIIKPVDVIPPLQENIIFIDSIIDVLKNETLVV